MKKKILVTILILVVVISAGIVYLNQVFLPTKIKSFLTSIIQAQTHKKVNLESLQFNIFKGLVLRNLTIYDDNRTFLRLKEGSCSFIVWPFFKKQIIIPAVKLKDARIFLERRADNTWNVMDLFGAKAVPEQKLKFNVFVYRVSIVNSRIDFQDDTLNPVFTKSLENANLSVSLSLPSSVSFQLKAEIPGRPLIKIAAWGSYLIPQQQLRLTLSIKNLLLKEFFAYYQGLGITPPEGMCDAFIGLKLKDDILQAAVMSQVKNISFSKDKVVVVLDSSINADIQYGLKDKLLKYSGQANISRLDVSGLQVFDRISGISGYVKFDDSGLSADNLNAVIFGHAAQATLRLVDYNSPLVNVELVTHLSLASLQSIMKEKFDLTLPVALEGEGRLELNLQAKPRLPEPPVFSGSLDISAGTIRSDKIKSPFEAVTGHIEFSRNQLKWEDLNFQYSAAPYKTSGTLTNFAAPGVQLKLSSPELSLASNFALNGSLVTLARLSGRYLQTQFSFKGTLDFTDRQKVQADIGGGMNIDLGDLGTPLKKFKNQLDNMKVKGKVQSRLNLNGDLNDIKSCTISAKFASPAVSLYGLKARGFFMDYNQAGMIGEVTFAHLALYDGTIDVTARINLASENYPYWVDTQIRDVLLEKLKLDTGSKDKDIAGVIQAQAKINGFSGDLSRLTGSGRITVKNGRLWELNLFKGLGSMLFARDFEKIVFSEGSCAFLIHDKFFSTDNLTMKSKIAEITGNARLGFDNSLDSRLDVNVLDEMVPLTGTFKDVTTAIVGQGGRFGVIHISGTLKEPKYKFKPAVANILKGITDIFFKK